MQVYLQLYYNSIAYIFDHARRVCLNFATVFIQESNAREHVFYGTIFNLEAHRCHSMLPPAPRQSRVTANELVNMQVHELVWRDHHVKHKLIKGWGHA